MKIRKTISIDRMDLVTLKPFLDANNNNLSLAIRELIEEYRLLTDQTQISGDQRKVIMLRNQIIEDRVAALVPVSLIRWQFKRNMGVPPLGIFRGIMEKYTRLLGIDNFLWGDYAKMVDIHNKIFGYRHSQHIESSPDGKNFSISFEGDDSSRLMTTVMNYSCMLAHYPLKLKTKKIIISPYFVKVDYEECNSEEEAYKSVMDHFGDYQIIFDEIQSNPEFWKNLACMINTCNYENVTLSRDIFLQLVKCSDFSSQLNNLISSIYGVPIEWTDYRDVVRFIDNICQTSGLIYRIEHDHEEIRIYHKFDENNIIRTINETIMKTLEMADQQFILKNEGKITILKEMKGEYKATH